MKTMKKTTHKTPRKAARPAPLFAFRVQHRRRYMMIHLGLETRWLAGLLMAAAGFWIGLEPLARLVQAAGKLP